jgi:hypothetical protein
VEEVNSLFMDVMFVEREMIQFHPLLAAQQGV